MFGGVTDIPNGCVPLGNMYPPAPRVERGMPLQLSAHPKKDKFCYANANFVVIRDLAVR